MVCRRWYFDTNSFCLVNTSDEPLRKKQKRDSDEIHEIAPEEKKKLSRWIKDKNHDLKAFPELFHDGQYGLNDPERKIKISARQNFNHKILNRKRKYAEDPESFL